MTKSQTSIYNRYLNSSDYELRHVYGSWSWAKENAMEHCKNEMFKKGGHNLKIVSHNVNVFTVGFVYTDEETGKEMFNYITRDRNESWEL